MWTRHEAELKCAGTGLLAAEASQGASVLDARACRSRRRLATAALALDAAPLGLSLWRWRPPPRSAAQKMPTVIVWVNVVPSLTAVRTQLGAVVLA